MDFRKLIDKLQRKLSGTEERSKLTALLIGTPENSLKLTENSPKLAENHIHKLATEAIQYQLGGVDLNYARSFLIGNYSVYSYLVTQIFYVAKETYILEFYELYLQRVTKISFSYEEIAEIQNLINGSTPPSVEFHLEIYKKLLKILFKEYIIEEAIPPLDIES